MAAEKERTGIQLASTGNCRACGAKLPKSKFRCRMCLTWNPPTTGLRRSIDGAVDDGTMMLHDVPDQEVARYQTGPWDPNFGDPPGIPDDAVVLVGGAPGAGKSTFALQLSDALAIGSKNEVLYLCAEESKQQIKARNVRLGLKSKGVRIVPLERMGDASLEAILSNRKLSGVVLDSIAGFTNDAERAVEIVSSFKAYAVQYRMPFIIINHITKDGAMAGMMKLQHAGDISLMLTKGEKDVIDVVRFVTEQDEDDEEDPDDWFEMTEVRELYTEKSRYGPSGVTTNYAMTGSGLIEVEYQEEDENG